MGNVEPHLILGNSIIHSEGELIVGHVAIETRNIKAIVKRLEEMESPFETNVSVPKANESEEVVTDFFSL